MSVSASRLLVALVLTALTPAVGQTIKPAQGHEPAKIYTYVEQMPELPGGGGKKAVTLAIKKLMLQNTPPEVLASEGGGLITSFIIGADGKLSDIHIARSLNPAADASALAAIKKLPRFYPGREGGLPVAVLFTIPIAFPIKLPEEIKY